ncbi:MAG: polysaccharide deacetylase family protein [Nitrospirota bacterium]
MTVLNALTVDVEEWYHICDAEPFIAPADWPSLPSRLMIGLDVLLADLAKAGARATFFVLGDAAARTPRAVPSILSAGHEIASHGCSHKQVYKMSPEEFEADLDRSVGILKEQGAGDVRGFRAPEWSIRPDSLWALDVLARRGFRYDSSIYPIRIIGMPAARPGLWRVSSGGGLKRAESPNTPQTAGPDSETPPLCKGRDGWGRCDRKTNLGSVPASTSPDPSLQRRGTEDGGTSTGNWALVEWTPPVRRIMGENVPFSGGLHLRLLPYKTIARWIRELNGQGVPALVYVHPWEMDPDPPRVQLGAVKRFVHYARIGAAREKLKQLLSDFRFAPIGAILDDLDPAALPEGPER